MEKAKKKKSDIQMIREIVHLLGIFTLFLGPLIVYFLRKEKAIQDEAKRVLNWQFSLLVYLLIAAIIEEMFYFSLGFSHLDSVLILINVIMSVIGFVKTSSNQRWEYPLSIRFFKK